MCSLQFFSVANWFEYTSVVVVVFSIFWFPYFSNRNCIKTSTYVTTFEAADAKKQLPIVNVLQHVISTGKFPSLYRNLSTYLFKATSLVKLHRNNILNVYKSYNYLENWFFQFGFTWNCIFSEKYPVEESYAFKAFAGSFA